MSLLRRVAAASCCVLAFATAAWAQTPPTCSSSLSAVPVPSPWFDLNLIKDPTTAGVSSFAYVPNDPLDSAANQAVHKGLVQLNGFNNVSYINMSATDGPYYGGATLPAAPIGGPSAGSLTAGTFGWSFEVTFKASAQVSPPLAGCASYPA